jgi:hypothetical protein
MKQRTYLIIFVEQTTYLITLPDRSPASEKIKKKKRNPKPVDRQDVRPAIFVGLRAATAQSLVNVPSGPHLLISST